MMIGHSNYVAVNQEIMRNVGVHTLILQALRLPFNGRRQVQRRLVRPRGHGPGGGVRGSEGPFPPPGRHL